MTAALSETRSRGGTAALSQLKAMLGAPTLAPRPSRPGDNLGARRGADIAPRAAAVEAPATAAPPAAAQGGGGGAPQPAPAPEFGYARGWAAKYKVLSELGRGGNGVVTLVADMQTGQEFATKSIPKVLTDPNISDRWAGGAVRRHGGCAARRGAPQQARPLHPAHRTVGTRLPVAVPARPAASPSHR